MEHYPTLRRVKIGARLAMIPEGFDLAGPREAVAVGYLEWDTVEDAWMPGDGSAVGFCPAELTTTGDTLRWSNPLPTVT